MNTRNQGTGLFMYLGMVMIIFIVIVILISGVYSTSVFNGRGTENQPYRIEKEEDLLLLSRAFLYQKEQYYDAYYLLERDLDLSQLDEMREKSDWIPIGNEDDPFQGSFDGNGKVIRNLQTKGNFAYTGLFGVIGKRGRVLNVTLEEVFIETYEGVTKSIGMIAGSNLGRIENVQVEGTLIGKTCCVGGMIGINAGIITDSLAKVKFIIEDDSEISIGGFVGKNFMEGSIKHSSAEVMIEGHQELVTSVNEFVGRNEGKIR